MTTIHARQILLTKMHIMKTTPSEESTVYSFQYFPTIMHTRFLPQSFASHHFTTRMYPSYYTPQRKNATYYIFKKISSKKLILKIFLSKFTCDSPPQAYLERYLTRIKTWTVGIIILGVQHTQWKL